MDAFSTTAAQGSARSSRIMRADSSLQGPAHEVV